MARRIFLLFISCALVPIGGLTILAFYQVSAQLRDQSRQHLEQAAKSHGMSTFQRLEMLDAELQVIALRLSSSNSPTLGEKWRGDFEGLKLVRGNSVAVSLLGSSFRTSVLNSEQIQHLNLGKPLVDVGTCTNLFVACIEMLRLLDARLPEKGMIVGTVNPKYLWDDDRLESGLVISVFDQGATPLLCSHDELIPGLRGAATAHPSSGFFRWSSGQGDYDAAYWSLFLNPQFHTGSWTFVLSQPHADALAPMERFRNLFPFVVLLALWVVILLSLVEIRRTLVPLEKLKAGTREIRANNFESRVEIHSGDEFQELAGAFNSMSNQLGRQFHVLKTINEIDQAILQSLDRDGIVAGVLNHMPYLLPASIFGVAMFDSFLTKVDLIFTFAPGAKERDSELAQSQLSLEDLRQLRQSPSSIMVGHGDRTPDFLQPLADRAMSSFLILPIFVESKPFAALVCAGAGSWPQIAAEGVQVARQVADQLAVAFSNVQLIETLEQFHWGTLTALARAIDAKSAWTSGHSERVTAMALRIAQAMGLGTKDLQVMQRGGLLHDIGKIGTPPNILDKAGKLDAEELRTMRDHVSIGLRILEPIPAFKEAIPIVAQHHEWFNGKGYPEGLAGDDISLHARIFAVADCYDALISDRPYRQGLPKQQVVKMLEEGSGTQFDPNVIDAFLRICNKDETSQHRPSMPDLAIHLV